MEVLEGEGIDVWARRLTAKYLELPTVALRKLMDETYKPQDLLRDRSPVE
jgi:hypothetical protein